MVTVPDLNAKSALDFSGQMRNYILKEGEEFNFASVSNCDPFPMLVVASSIRNLRKCSDIKKCKAINCNNGYAEHMRFYKAIGINIGKGFEENYGNQKYLPITKLNVEALRKQGASSLERIQEVIVNKSMLMANVLSQGNNTYKKWLSYALTEIMRNIPEHSKAEEIWYCAQYWPSFDLVELAIMDEGIGVKSSLLSNSAYEDVIQIDEDALRFALSPGISRTFAPGGSNLSDDEWANSGFGLYMVSRTCAALGGSFVIASGTSAVKVDKNNLVKYRNNCHVVGTVIRIRVHLSQMDNYENIAKRILREGEIESGSKKNTIKEASRSSKSILGY